jgi:hypothetical protein
MSGMIKVVDAVLPVEDTSFIPLNCSGCVGTPPLTVMAELLYQNDTDCALAGAGDNGVVNVRVSPVEVWLGLFPL